MLIWLVTIGEPLPLAGTGEDRLLRAGYFFNLLAEAGHEVTWWSSTFDHFRRRHWFTEDATVDLGLGRQLRLLHGCGYRRSISVFRLMDHALISRKFRKLSQIVDVLPDIILASFPPVGLALEAVRFGKNNNIPVVLDMRDMWPDIFLDLPPRPLRPFAKLALQPMFLAAEKASHEATAITGITDGFVEWGLTKTKRRREKWDRSFPMGYCVEPLQEEDIREAEQFWDSLGVLDSRQHLRICFFGTLGKQLQIAPVIEAAKRLGHKAIPVEFVICGTGDQLDRYRKMSKGASNILLPGWVNKAKIRVLMDRSDAGINPMPDRFDFLATINNKAIEYMSAGLPMLVSPTRGVLYELVVNNNIGFGYDREDIDGLCRFITLFAQSSKLVSEMRTNARALFEEKFDARKVYSEMESYLQELKQFYTPKHDRKN